MALGLRKRMQSGDLENCKYGDDLPVLNPGRPTALKRIHNSALVGIGLAVHCDVTGAITAIDISATNFETSRLREEAPRNFAGSIPTGSFKWSYRKCDSGAISEQELGRVRRAIHSFLEPYCYDDEDASIWPYQEHSQHKKCHSRRNLIFILPNKHVVLGGLRSLGCNLETLVDTLDILDLRELNQAYLARCDANIRGPEFDGHRTEISQNDRLHTVDDILKARGCPLSNQISGALSMNIIKAAVKMACDDATSVGWVRTREQVGGGRFIRPMGLPCLSDQITYLLRYDVSTTKQSCRRTLRSEVAKEEARCRLLPFRVLIAITANRAQRHRYTKILTDRYGLASLEDQTAKTMELVRIAGEEKRPETTTLFTSATTSPHIRGIPATAPSTQDMLPKNQELPQELAKLGHDYRVAGRNITTRLVTFLESKMESWTEGEKAKVQPMYSKAKRNEFGDYCWTSYRTFESAARKARELGWKMDDEAATWFTTAITGRRKLRDWYDRLATDDTRFKDNDDHEAWLQTLINVVFALAGHQY